MPPRITPFSFEDGAFLPGQYATVQCVIPEGDLPIYIKWLFNGSPISDAMGVTIMKAGKRMSILTIDNLSAYNSGRYICKAENSAGMAAYATELTINGLISLYIFFDFMSIFFLF